MAKTVVKDLPIEDVVEGTRFREDLGDINELMESIKTYGILQPLVVDSDNRLIAGGRRLTAARSAGLSHVPCVVHRGSIDDGDLRELELVENIHRKQFAWHEEVLLVREIHRLKTGEALKRGEKWSLEKTKDLFDKSRSAVSKDILLADALSTFPEIKSCKDRNEAQIKVRDISIAVAAKVRNEKAEEAGLKEAKENLKKQVERSLAVDEARAVLAPLQKPMAALIQWPISQVQDWTKHRMINGDFFAEVAKIVDGTFEFINCDPPYGIDVGTQKKNVKSQNIDFDDSAKWYMENLPKIVSETYRVAKDGTWMVFWFAMKHYGTTKLALEKAGWSVNPTPAIWVKPNGGSQAPATNLGSFYETFFYCQKGKPVLGKSGAPNVFHFGQPKSKFHQTQKPVALMTSILETFTMGPVRVLDAFMGSGSTAIAACLRKCRYTGFELNEDMLNLARVFAEDYIIRGVTDE
jgi:ParB/RepB/Spo0J family partition protein